MKRNQTFTSMNYTAPALRTSFSGFLLALGVCVFVAGCAPVKVSDQKRTGPQVIFPAPPDDPRFVYERTIVGSADVIPDSEESILRRTLTGQSRASEGLSKPYAIATFEGKVLVTDSGDRSVKVFDIPNGKFYKIGASDDGPLLAQPLGIDVDKAGNVYIADGTPKMIMIYDINGKFQRKIGGPDVFDRLSSVTIDPKGDRLYVVDIGGVSSEHHRVRVFEVASGKHLFDIGKRGSGKGEFNLPRDIAVGKDGNLYVVDGGNFRVQVFDRNGAHLKSFGQVGKQLGNFARPKEIASDKQGNLYVADAAFGNFQIFDPEGQLLMFVGDRSEQNGPGLYMLPSGIAVDDDGRIFFVDQWFRKIDVFRPVGLGENEGAAVRRRPPTTSSATTTNPSR